MTALGQVLIATSVLACGIIYGTDVLSAIVLRPALALADDQTLVSMVRRMYEAVGPDGKRQHTVAETAEAVGVHRTTVYDYLNKEG